jgi:pyruvate/2-oxoglutarate dehydrogenase complex dihydrolipoamide dehydrogenase (E3) component
MPPRLEIVIPSKALLHTAEFINEAAEAQHLGVTFNEPKIDIDAVRKNKDDIVSKLMIACSNSITSSVASILICVLETNLP